ncbi:hypothetical protein BDM02DRAFT_3194303 [Thelephora ganbajun]|uniref:Uncharacterized protein n=1 Tax=Thelephora ganbajun TaxID=370292 RepID=A0ACB6YXU3_THEGA|nr:hypothetical protein BDM02DRAFT_3194303 [Thelephora ganbajun]
MKNELHQKSLNQALLNKFLSVIAEASAELPSNLPIERLLPYDEHFHPTVPKTASLAASGKPEVGKLGHPMVGVNVLPHEEQVIADGALEMGLLPEVVRVEKPEFEDRYRVTGAGGLIPPQTPHRPESST